MVIKVSNGYNNILSCKEHFNQCLASVKPAYKSGSTTNVGRKHKFGGTGFRGGVSIDFESIFMHLLLSQGRIHWGGLTQKTPQNMPMF